MSSILGALNLNDTDRVFGETVGQRVVYDLIEQHISMVQMDIDRAMSIFIDANTEDFKWRYKLPGGGRLQNMGFDPQSRPGAVKTTGGWDVAFPLEAHQAQVAFTKVAMSYLTVADLERHVTSVIAQNVNSQRFELLKAIFNNTQDTFVDPLHGSLSVEPFANDDANVYPPVIGSETEATEDHYLGSAFLASAISDANNPYVTIEADLVHHFGKSQGNDNVAVFINSAQKAVTEDLTDFTEVTDRFVIPGTQTARLTGLPISHPGRVIGRTNGCWVIEWDWITASYMLGVHLDVDPALMRRTDPANTGLSAGLQLIFQDEDYPFSADIWDNRFGLGAANRLNGVVMDMSNADSDYDIPTAYV